MTGLRGVVLAVALSGAGGVALAQSLDTTLGRQVAARADAPSVADVDGPRGNYLLHCSGCHRADGRGAPERYVPDLRQAARFLQLPDGRRYIVGVPGVMGSGLDDTQVAAVINWLMATIVQDPLPGDHREFDAGEVARIRSTPLVDVAAERRRLQDEATGRGIMIR